MCRAGVSIYDGWVTKIAKQLKLLEARWTKSACHSFSKAEELLTSFRRHALPCSNSKAEVVIVQFGLNDCNHWDTDHGLPRVSLDAFIANMKRLLNA